MTLGVQRLKKRLLDVGPRLEPGFLIIGAQKCGTTSLYRYVCRHPNVLRASTKELHFFAAFYSRGWEWYRAQFPTRLYALGVGVRERSAAITGEASPSYIFHPAAPLRIRRHLPNVKLIALFRNPVDRAYSHYQHSLHRGYDNLPFEEAIDREAERLDGERERLLADESYVSPAYQGYSYLARGVYADQLQNLFGVFPRDQILALRAEDLFERPEEILSTVFHFLGLPPARAERYVPQNVGGYESTIPPELRPRLVEYFRPHNERLRSLVDWEPNWDR